MRRLVEKTASWGMDGAMCGMMNALQWRRRADSSTRHQLSRYVNVFSPMTREEFYKIPPVKNFRQHDGWLDWESPLPSGYPENDRAHVRFYPAAQKNAPVLLLLHALMSASDVGYRRVAATFNRRGWSVAFPHLPYHYSRTPKSALNGELAITADLVRNAEGLRQAVVELRQLMTIFRSRGTREFSLIGTSYGGWTGALLSFLERDFRFLALVQPIVNVDKAIWENPGAKSMRRSLRAHGHSREKIVLHDHLISPLHGTPLCSAERIIVTAGDYDRISPLEDLKVLTSRWKGSRLLRVRQGHFGYRALRETLLAVEPFL
jgi:pimeloyl-ACP methyl ester carboxylesterase